MECNEQEREGLVNSKDDERVEYTNTLSDSRRPCLDEKCFEDHASKLSDRVAENQTTNKHRLCPAAVVRCGKQSDKLIFN